MIIKWAVDALSYGIAAILAGVGALVPSPPGWVATGLGQVGQLYEKAGAFDAWIPVPLALTILAFVLTVQAVVVVMLLVRMGVSYATFGGGVVSK